jgi:phage terminase large subunit-like protein
VREIAYDPWRFESEALRLEAETGLQMVEFLQWHTRMTVASEGLHAAVGDQRLQHPGDAYLDRHVAGAIAKATGRGRRLEKAACDSQMDAAVALAMAVERAQAPVPEVQFVGWL